MTATKRPLMEALQQVKDRGVTYAEMERISERSGDGRSHEWFARYTKGSKKFAPREQDFPALAAVLSITVEDVRRLAAEEFGYAPRDISRPMQPRYTVYLPADATDEDVVEAQRVVDAYYAARHPK